MRPLRLVVSLITVAALLAATVDSAAAVSVERIGGAARADTAAALARATTSSPTVVYLVAGTEFADALTAGSAAAADGGVVALVDTSAVPRATRELLADVPASEVVVVGGERRLSPELDARVAAVRGASPIRVAGADRYATAAALAGRAFPDGASTVWLASGRSAADALAAGAAAGATGGALLLTDPRSLPAATVSALRDLAPDRVHVTGGPAAVGAAVLDQLVDVLGDTPVRRVAGSNRYETAATVAATAFPGAEAAVVTTGLGWADALAATPLAARRVAPILLVPRRCVPAETAAALRGVRDVVIAGGPVAVSPRVEHLSACADEITAVTAEDLGPSWRPGCPVGPADLRRVLVDHLRLSDGAVVTGELIVHRRVAGRMVGVFDRLFTDGFRLHRVANVAEYGADDDRAMAANATTAFNCRNVAGTSTWSEHSYGTAIDVNPVQNPYVSSRGAVSPPAGSDYLDRGRVRPGMVVAGGAADRAFSAVGWEWGGRWTSSKDYQHFSESGR